ncbi:MAG: uroporphyrinogen decarboxylase family protein [Clostridia bacterium]|nr:uroporphyrinogen decarboxylase family protein [Clostridia bacterium]
MKKLVKSLLENKARTLPILSFPSTQLLGISVNELIRSAENQAKGMKAIMDRCNMGAALNMMDLSVEAEAFGAKVKFEENEVPAVTEGLISDISEAYDVKVPSIGAGRTNIYVDGVKKAKEIITDAPVFCGVIGPYSLAGRIFDMMELMMSCYDDPDGVKELVNKCKLFLIDYLKAFKAAGADGVVMAEPASGMLSPDMCEEFSTPYVKEIIDAVADENFVFVYHNCGNNTIAQAETIASLGADVYHFGNAIDLSEMIPLMPEGSVVMGNVDPVLFKTSTPEVIEKTTREVFEKCNKFDNFMLSSGCDIPAEAKWENLDAYFSTVKKLYE